MKPIKLIVKTNSERYPIIIGRNLISNLSRIFKTNSINFKKCLLVLDKNIPNKYVKQISRSLKKCLKILSLRLEQIIIHSRYKKRKNMLERFHVPEDIAVKVDHKDIFKVVDLIPASSPMLSSIILVLKPFFSDHLKYIL